MQGDDPPFLTVGTDVSAKYKGAFCEAKVKKVVRNIKCKVTLKGGGSITVNDDTIKGNLRVGNTVEVKHDPKKDAMEAVITKMQDCSQYTVVFDDGDITTLRRSALCLKSGRHFNESETLDQLPLTHPEHFSTPVIAGRRGRRGRALSEESEPDCRRRSAPESEREPHMGRVVLVEMSSGAERRRPHQAAFPALVVAPSAQESVKINIKEDYLVRSFKDGRFYTVPKKETREFRKNSAPLEWGGVEPTLQYLNNGVLPPHWDRESLLLHEPRNTSDDSSDDEPREEKDHFVAQLYKFMDDRGTPINRTLTIANREIDLFRLFREVRKLGGYNRVTNQNQWKMIAGRMGFNTTTTNITNLCKQFYKRILHDYEDFYRKLGVTLVAHPRGARTPPAGRSLIRDRDKQQPPAPAAPPAPVHAPPTPTSSRVKEEPEKPEKPEKPVKVEKKETKAEAKPEVIAEKQEKHTGTAKSEVSDEDSADNQPLAAPTPAKAEKEEKEKPREKEKEKEKEKRTEERKEDAAPRSRAAPAVKRDSHERRTPKPRRPLSTKSEGGSGCSSGGSSAARSSRRLHASTDSDSSGRASRCGITKKTPSRRSQSANSASSGNTIASSNSSKRLRKRIATDRTSPARGARAGGVGVGAAVGDKLKVYYGPTQSESKVTYEAKVIEVSPEGMLRVHYTGWNTRYDEWIKPQRIALNVTQHDRSHSKPKDGNSSRRARASRIQQDRTLRSDSDSDSDSEDEIKPPPKRIDEKPPNNNKAPPSTPSTKEETAGPSGVTPPARTASTSEETAPATAERSRKRTVRGTPPSVPAPTTPSVTTAVSPPKKPRITMPHASHQGRDYDLNEIRSELKGLQTVKTEPEEVKQEPIEKTPPPPEVIEEPKQEKPDDDVYEFKEPEPFEFELHDEKKKRTHRIFDDVSPKYSMKSIIEDMTEEIRSRPTQRSPSLSPFRDFSARDTPGRRTPEDESRDDIFSLDGDSFPGDSSLGPIFEGFIPAKNQETYSKKSSVLKHRELLDDSPESPDEDEQSTDEDQMENIVKEDSDPPVLVIEPSTESTETTSESLKDNPKEPAEKEAEPASSPKKSQEEPAKEPPPQTPSQVSEETKSEPLVVIPVPKEESDTVVEEDKLKVEKELEVAKIEKKPKIEKEKPKIEEKPKVEKEKPKVEKEKPKIEKEKPKIEKEKLKLDKEKPKIEICKTPPRATPEKKVEESKKIENVKTTLAEPIRSALVDTEESKSEPDSPARMDECIPEPPPAFLLHSEGPKIAEKLLKAIKSAKKRISTSPPPQEEPPKSFKRDFSKLTDPFQKEISKPQPTQSEIAKIPVKSEPIRPAPKTDKVEPMKTPLKPEAVKPLITVDPPKTTPKVELAKKSETDIELVFKMDPPLESKQVDLKREKLEASLAPLQSALDVLERRRSGSELPLAAPGKSNKVLSDTIQKLSSQITQAAAAIPLPTFPPEDRSDSSDSDDSDRRLIIDKLSEEDTGSGSSSSEVGGGAEETSALLQDKTKSPVEWSAGESLLMLEDFCKAERQPPAGRPHSTISVPKPSEEDSNISLLLCEETIPGSPAPEGAGAAATDSPSPAPARARSLQMPFASAPSNSPEEASTGKGRRPSRERESKGGEREREREARAEWELEERSALDNTPPTTPDTSPDVSPHRERRMSEQDSAGCGAATEDDTPAADKASHQPAKLFSGRCRKVSESSGAGASAARRARRSRRDSDEPRAPHPAPPLKYNFYVELDPLWDSNTRINLLMTRLTELRRAYHSVKVELAAVDRRRKKLRRKEREAVKAAKAACS